MVICQTGAHETGEARLTRVEEGLKSGHSGALVLRVDAATLLADRASVSRGLLDKLLGAGGGGGVWLEGLRRQVPGAQSMASWFSHHTDMSAPGAQRVEAALASPDFSAVRALLARENPLPRHIQGESHAAPEDPLGERDARALLALIFERLGPEVIWVLVSGLEELLWPASPHAQAFCRGFEAWWRRMLELRGVCLVASSWGGARERLSTLWPGFDDAVVGRAHPEVPCPARLAPEEIARGLALQRRLGEIVHEPGRSAWRASREGANLLFVWPSGSRDPARRLVEVVGESAGGFEGDLEVVAPRWAFGGIHAPSRRSLVRAFSELRWSPMGVGMLCEAASALT